jgi:putative redox protein
MESVMVTKNIKAIIRSAGDELFIGTTPSGHSVTFDTNSERSIAPSPVEILLVALGSCTAVDVIGILQKKRQLVTSYTLEVTGERRDEYPRSYKSMKVHHILTGTNISPKAVAQAIELSETKYCSVAATLRPTVEIQSSFEIIEEGNDSAGVN